VEKVLLQFIAIRFHQKALAVSILWLIWRSALTFVILIVGSPCRGNMISLSHRAGFPNFHLAPPQNHLALRALDKLSAAHAVTPKQAARKRREQHATKHFDSRNSSMDALNIISPVEGLRQNSYDEAMMVEEKPGNRRRHNREQAKKKKKKLTAAVMEQLGGAIGQVALKDSKFNRAGEIGRSE